MKQGKSRANREIVGLAVTAALLLCLVSALPAQTTPNPRVNQNAAVATDFDKRISDYLKLQQKARSGLTVPKGTGSSAKIGEFQHELAAKIRELRPQAKQGDIFTPESVALFRRLITASLNGPEGGSIRKSYRRAEPIHGIRLEVNQSYPDGLPLQSMPPSLLLNLPRLPKELEYRFVGQQLILRDVAANLIVDIIPNIAVPEKQ